MANPLTETLCAATDEELPFIEDAAIRAGVLWRCTKCADTYPPEVNVCEGCGTGKLAPYENANANAMPTREENAERLAAEVRKKP